MTNRYDPGSSSFKAVVVFATFNHRSQQHSTKSSIKRTTTSSSAIPSQFPHVLDNRPIQLERTSRGFFLWHSMVWYICLEFISLAVFFNSICLGQDAKEEGVVELNNSIGMKLVLIRKGTFIMGSPEEELGRDKFGRDQNETQHTVTIMR